MNGLLDQYQGMSPGGLLMSGAPNSIQPLLGGSAMNPGTPGVGGNPLTYQMGPWSQLAYRMAGSPVQGPSPSVPVPTGMGGSAGSTTLTRGAGAGLGLTGLLQDAKTGQQVYNAASGLLNPGVSQGSLASLYAQGAPAADAVQPVVTSPAQAGITTPDGPLYSGATNANADLAAQEADNYAASGGLLGSSGAAGAGSIDSALAAQGGTAASTATSGVAGGELTADAGGEIGADAAAEYGGTTAAAPSTGLGAAAGTAAAIAIPAAIAIAGLQNQQTNSGLAFTQSLGNVVNGKYGGMFTQDQYNQIQQQYHSLGENGFWQWFNQAYPGISGPGTSNVRASYKPT